MRNSILTALNTPVRLLMLLLFPVMSAAHSIDSSIMHLSRSYDKISSDYNTYLQTLTINANKRIKQFRRWEHFWENRLLPNGNIPDGRILLNELSTHSRKEDKLQAEPIWSELGPRFVTQTQNPRVSGNGRINAIWQKPDDNNVFLIGAASGGLWKTSDRFNTWRAVGLKPMLSIGITDIASSDTEPNIVYAITGDGNGWLVSRCYSVGVIKSYDAGDTWEILQPEIELSENLLYSRILVHPENSDIVMAGSNKGLLRSFDGGKTWKRHLDGYFIRDIEFLPGIPDVVYAASFSFSGSAKVFKSEDMGESWFEVKTFLYSDRINLAVTPDAPLWIYALCSDSRTSGFEGLYLSKNAGDTWTKIETSADLVISQGFYNLAIWVNPSDRNNIFAGGIELMESTDGGVNWKNHNSDIHVDHHNIFQIKDGGSLLNANDGGIYEYNLIDKVWKNVSGGLSITQFYRFCSSHFHDRIYFGGSQDNGTMRSYLGRWEFVSGGDGMECIAVPDNASIVYASMQNGVIFISEDGGKRFYNSITNFDFGERKPWLVNFKLNPQNSEELYLGYENVWKTTNRGANWLKLSDFNDGGLIGALALGKVEPDYIFASKRKELFASSDGGATWTFIHSFSENITSIEADFKEPELVRVTLGGYTASEKIYEVSFSSKKNISHGLPNVPVSSVATDKHTGIIYIGTDIGVYKRTAGGDWEKFSGNMPPAIVTKLEIHYGSGNLRASTFGRGLWETNIFQCLVSKPILNETGTILLCRGDSILLEVTNPVKNYDYMWSDGQRGTSIFAKKAGEVFVKGVTENDCYRASEMVTIETLPRPDVRIMTLGPYPVCEGGTIFLTAFLENHGGETYEFEWSNGEKERTIGITRVGKYYVTIKSRNGCLTMSEPIDVVFHSPPVPPEIIKTGGYLSSSEGSSYQWFFNAQAIPDAINRELQIESLGTYFVEITDSNGCRNVSLPFVVMIESNADTSNFTALLYPNPAEDLIILEAFFNKRDDIKIIIYDANGRAIMENIFSSHKGYLYKEFIIASLAPGAYFLKLHTHDITKVFNFVKYN